MNKPKVIGFWLIIMLTLIGANSFSGLTSAQNPPAVPEFTPSEEDSTDDALNESSNSTDASSDSFALRVEVRENKDSFSENEYYEVRKFAMVVGNSSDLCPTGDCKFSFEHDLFDGLHIDGVDQRSLDGTLKVSKDGKNKLYSFSGDLQVVEEETNDEGEAIKEILEGSIGISSAGQDRDYQVNGTLTWKNNNNAADLALQGKL